MSLKTISNAITSRAGRRLLTAQKHSPAILFGVGVVGVVATVVVASRATMKIESIMDEHDELLAKINEAGALLDETVYSEADAKKDLLVLKLKTFGKIARLYTPALALGAISIGCLTGSHVVLTRRNVALTAAYALVEQSFRDYRDRVINEYGKDKDAEYRFGTVDKEVIVNGKTSVATVLDKSNPSMYTFLFDEVNSKSYSPDWGYNQTFLASQQVYANLKLRARGYLFLNDVLDGLGIARVPYGQVVGWLADPERLGRKGDEYVDFGLGDTRDSSVRFTNGDDRAVWLDFNVDGNIMDLIGKAAR